MGASTGRFSAAICAVASSVLAACAAPAAAQPFYQGKTLTIVVGTQSGGGFDINSRILARHVGRHIPGRPDVIVTNMPGAGSLVALRYVDSVAPRDGTVIVNFNFGLIGMSRLAYDKAPIDFTRFAWIGSISQDQTACYLWHAYGVHSLADLAKRRNVHFGETAPGGNDDINAKILKNLFGVDIRQVGGYPGSASMRLALERGELDGGCGSWNSLPEDWVAKRLVTPVFHTGPTAVGDMPPDVPSVLELAPTPRDRAVVQSLTAHNELGRPYVLSQAVPADRVETLRTAFDETMTDPEFVAEAARLRMPVSPRSGPAALRVVQDIYATPDDIIAAARKVFGE